jgi:hypothetical protein
MINRRTAKRQIAASRALLQLIRSHNIDVSSAHVCTQFADIVDRLQRSTESLARETYQPQETQP